MTNRIGTSIFGDPFALAMDRELQSSELYIPNEWYGHARAIRSYANVPSNYQLKAAVEHFPALWKSHWDDDLHAQLPAIFIAAPFRKAYWKTLTHRPTFCVGPLFHYAPNLLHESVIQSEKRRLGKNVLVMPEHSTHYIDLDWDEESFIEEIKRASKGYDSVRICVYWKDILRGKGEVYSKAGFEIVTAGHMYDVLFLSRIKSILSTADLVLTNQVSTSLGYATSLNIPVHLMEELRLEKSVVTDAPSGVKLPTDDSELNSKPSYRELRVAFADRVDRVTNYQRQLVNKYWGLDQVKSPADLLAILEICEIMYSQGPHWFLGNANCSGELVTELERLGETHKARLLREALVVEEEEEICSLSPSLEGMDLVRSADQMLSDAIEKVQSGETSGALAQVLEVRKLRVALQDLELVYGLCLLQAGDLEGAKSAFQEELQHFPANNIAREMLSQLVGG